MTRTRMFLVAAAVLTAASPLAAQTPRADRIGHVVAIVGDSVVLNFDIQTGVLAYEAQTRQKVPPELLPALHREILEDRINGLLLVQAAMRDTTIRITDDQLARVVQQRVEEQQRQLGGPVQFEQALRAAGLSLQDYRTRMAAQIRSQELINQFQGKIRRERKAPPATEQDLRDMFEEQKAAFGERPATITFQQIVVRSEPSTEALAAARARADSIYVKLAAGEEFAELAKRYSDDPSRASGGDLGWSRRNEWVRDFSAVAWQLRPGEISAPVRTQFGYHIIKAERARGAEMQLRHILFKPVLTEEDARRARARADTVADRLRAGADPVELHKQYGDQDQPLRNGPAPLDTVQATLAMDLTSASPGAIIGPVPTGGDEIASQFVVMKVIELEAPRAWTVQDPLLRETLRQRVETSKLMNEVLQELRRSTYVEIRSGT